MRRSWVVLIVLLLAPSLAAADAVVLKNGKTKEGKIIEETDEHVLIDSKEDGMVMEVKRSDISIIDRAVEAGTPTKGSVGFFSTSPRKRKKKSWFPELAKEDATVLPTDTQAESEPEKPGGMDQAGILSKLESYFQEWTQKNPETSRWMDGLIKSFKGKSDEFDRAVDAAKNS